MIDVKLQWKQGRALQRAVLFRVPRRDLIANECGGVTVSLHRRLIQFTRRRYLGMGFFKNNKREKTKGRGRARARQREREKRVAIKGRGCREREGKRELSLQAADRGGRERERGEKRVKPAGCRQRHQSSGGQRRAASNSSSSAKRKLEGDRHLALLLSLGFGPILKWSRLSVLVSIVLFASVVLAEPPRYRQQNQQQRQYYFARQQEEAAPYPASGWKPAGPAFNLPQRQLQQYEAPSAPQQQYGGPSAPQQQYGAPNAPQQQYGAPNTPQQQYGAPSAPQQQYGAPSAPQQQYGAPSTSRQQYGAPSAPRQYGGPSNPQREYGEPEEATTTETPNTTEEEEVSTVQGITESESEPVNAVNELEDEDVDEKQPQQSGEYYVALPDGRLQRVKYISRQDVEAMKYFAKIRAENVEPLRGPIYAYAPLQKLQVVPAGLQLSVAPVAPADTKPQKLEIEPVAAQVQYQYDNPSRVIPLINPLNTAYTANYQAPAADSRFLLTFQ
ncbi:Zinc metalloprotease zmpB [Temnothorax longispinosus]|uniref:Zinc metalloprotease zmpB n=1 Tax=Temnothorax longispinosus TaxID=300112 RepID=A0A4S2KHY0_9HYME|nr:Zinc metalloprotease zmpB [Temnothorax longispinosus]